MKKISLFLITLLLSAHGFSQTILYQDDMESYPLNSYLAVQNPTWWSTWSALPGSGEDIQVKNIFGHSGTQSGSIDTEGGATDALLLLGDKFTGSYELSWWFYIPAGKCGYYNIQHFETPGTEYAMHVFFRANGTFEMTTGGQTFYGTYPQDTWFQVKHNIDLDANYISLYINGNFIHDWPFNYQIYYAYGTKQLGSVDFGAYAVTGSNEIPLCYLDDVLYEELSTGAIPDIQVDPGSLATSVVTGSTRTEPMTVSNTGVSALTYNINVIYLSDKKGDNADSTAKLHYDGDHYISIGWSAPPVTVTVAARFPNSMTVPYAGMDLTSVEVYVDQLNTGSNLCTVRIFGMGTAGQPGPLITSEAFTPAGGGWDTIVLSNPVTVTGEDLWVGYTFTQTDPGIYIPGVDAGPLNPDGDFLNTGGGWTHLSAWPGFINNWNIRANLEGIPGAQWLSANPMQDTIGPGNSQLVDVLFDATGLTTGQYHATLKYVNNDPLNAQVDVPVTLDVVGVGIDEAGSTAMLAYPNPVKDRITVKTNIPVTGITISDTEGRTIYTGKTATVDVSGLECGIYILKCVTEKGTSCIKFVKTQ